ncbi:c-type cytochrome biogenesis protein CcmI [Paracoccus litorisediminis]|jgi:cytochrome c-type biogenesis protein CcmH|uniref:C-type cytochrome biogenesis protein CcmI n=1 Tax=Paracoccus litorisediminis TaxID=2006130 RepID=A0A844HJ29_9RHOB|nr:c-type cytochrome biogenesis protein CcmI [Paracoccus litorisediminis]MTH58454.1 c-type cytochrome biogenesis protein CcmI [Paracoccus litorisediminis]
MFWMICAALSAIVAIAIAAPLLRRRAAGEQPAAAYDLRIYRDQLREVERDLERRVVEPAEAERLRNEIGRKVLAADRALATETASGRTAGGPVALAVLGLLLLGTVLLYRHLGSPDMPDEPIGTRIAHAEANYANRPSQAEAEKAAPKPERAQPDADYAALIEQLRATVAKNPDDQRGQELLAQHEERLGNLVAAKEAQTRLIALRGDKASAADYTRLAGLTIEAAGGLITREAEDHLDRALVLDPMEQQARFLSGLLQIQSGRPDLAFPIWSHLLVEDIDNAPWHGLVRASIKDLAWFAGVPDYTPPDQQSAPQPGALPGPDAETMAAAQDMTPEDRQQMIQGMVKGLESRLATQGGTPEEWARLISALVVLGQKDHAQDILGEARTRFASIPEALATIEAAGKQSGLQ